MTDRKDKIPRKIWILWYQGVSDAPFIVQRCIESWIKQNPTWEVIILESSNIDKYVTLDIPEETLANLPLAHQSDLIRLLLLSKYGGVWCDATTLCNIPLDMWIDEYTESQFFMFEKPGADRLISNWFIASQKNSPICLKLYNELKSYWMKNNFTPPNIPQRILNRVLSKILNRSDKTTKYWFNPVVTEFLKIYPYFVFHYLFERLISVDIESKTIWHSTKKLSATPPHLIQKLGFFTYPDDAIKKKINNNKAPLYKLTWKFDETKYTSSTLLHYVLEENRIT